MKDNESAAVQKILVMIRHIRLFSVEAGLSKFLAAGVTASQLSGSPPRHLLQTQPDDLNLLSCDKSPPLVLISRT